MHMKHHKSPVCLMKHKQAETIQAENSLWEGFLRDYPVPFVRWKTFGVFVSDFYCAEAGLIVEVEDAPKQEGSRCLDEESEAILTEYGVQMLRLTAQEIQSDFAQVCTRIEAAVQ